MTHELLFPSGLRASNDFPLVISSLQTLHRIIWSELDWIGLSMCLLLKYACTGSPLAS